MTSGQPQEILSPPGDADPPGDGGTTDAQLLERFLAHHDEAAFEALVRRHGPMVLGVCRRVLHDPHDVDDAFQATFLVLVRKAASVGRRELLGNWLYGVAHRTALDARAAAARRRTRERQVTPMPEPQAADAAEVAHDLRPLLDRELSRLPDKYRVAVVLCDLEGRTRRDVARQLGLPVGTLSGRLTAAHRLLARRLARAGLALSAGALAAALTPNTASAAVPAPLLTATVAAAAAAGRGGAGAASAHVAALAAGVVKAMLLKTLKVAAAGLLAVGFVLATAAVVLQADREAHAGAARVLKLEGNGRRVAWSPDGRTLAVVEIYESFLFGKRGSAVKLWDVERGEVRQTLADSTLKGLAFQQVAFSPDGQWVAATVSEEVVLPGARQIRDVITVWDAKTLAPSRTLGGDSQLDCLAWSPDGKRLAAGDPGRRKVQVWDVGTGVLERTLSTGQDEPWSLAFAPDGKTLVVGGQRRGGSGGVTLWDPATGKLKRAVTLAKFVTAVACSPNGKLVAAVGGDDLVPVWGVEQGEPIVALHGSGRGHRTVAFLPDGRLLAAGGADGRVRLWDVPTGALKQPLEGHSAEVYALAVSPNGRTLATASQDQTLRLWPLGGQSEED